MTGPLALKAARVIAVAEAMGIWRVSAPVTRLDAALFTDVLAAMASAGVASKAAFEFDQDKAAPDRLGPFLDRLYEDLHASPVPELELPALGCLFSVDELAGLAGIGPSSLRRYLNEQRDVPEPVADRAHFLALVVADLAGSYNNRGVRRWFDRGRPQLGGRTPRSLLEGEWSPEDEGPRQVAAFAAGISGDGLSGRP